MSNDCQGGYGVYIDTCINVGENSQASVTTNMKGLLTWSWLCNQLHPVVTAAVMCVLAEVHSKPEGGSFGAFIKDTLLGPKREA
jgi:hypothetical protein